MSTSSAPPRPGVVIATRYAGLAATTVLAVTSWQIGALPWQEPGQLTPFAPLLAGAGWRHVAMALWLVAAAALTLSWWLLGRSVRRGGVALSSVLINGAIWAVPLLLAAPVASHDLYSYACQGQAFLAGADPYRVGPAGLPCPWLTAVPPIWRDQPAPYGPAAILLSAVPGGSLLVTVLLLRLAAVAGLVLVALAIPGLARRCDRDPAAALWLGLVNPVVLIHLVGGAHHDALLTGLIVAGLALATYGRGAWAGIVLGLAVAVKATAVVVVPFAVLVVVAAGRPRARSLVTLLGAAAGAFTALTLATGLDLGWLRALPVASQPVSWLSLPSGLGTALGGLGTLGGWPDARSSTVDLARMAALTVVLPVTLAAVWWRAARTATVRAGVVGAGVALAATVALAPVVYPWYLGAPVAVLAAVVPARLGWKIAVLTAVVALVVLPTSKNLAISTLWPGAVAELVAVAALAARPLWRRRRREPDPASAAVTGG